MESKSALNGPDRPSEQFSIFALLPILVDIFGRRTEWQGLSRRGRAQFPFV